MVMPFGPTVSGLPLLPNALPIAPSMAAVIAAPELCATSGETWFCSAFSFRLSAGTLTACTRVFEVLAGKSLSPL
jgi:hypothetical protein